jgi:hypothetical protein
MINPVRLIFQEIDEYAWIEVGEGHLVNRMVECVICTPLNAIEHVCHLTMSRWPISVSRGGGEAGERYGGKKHCVTRGVVTVDALGRR